MARQRLASSLVFLWTSLLISPGVLCLWLGYQAYQNPSAAWLPMFAFGDYHHWKGILSGLITFATPVHFLLVIGLSVSAAKKGDSWLGFANGSAAVLSVLGLLQGLALAVLSSPIISLYRQPHLKLDSIHAQYAVLPWYGFTLWIDAISILVYLFMVFKLIKLSKNTNESIV
jgi:hypothetical protein